VAVLVLTGVALAKPQFGGKWIGEGLARQPEGIKPPKRILFRVDNNDVIKDFGSRCMQRLARQP
jgi:hypothetical protein